MSGESPASNGNGRGHVIGDGNGDVPRQVRYDPSRGSEAQTLGPPKAGRAFVLTLAFFLAAFSLAVFVVFRQWRDEYEELTAYGVDNVATTVQPLAKRVPPGMTPEAWERVVDQSRVLLEGLSGMGLWDRAQMQNLRRELQLQVSPARSENSATILEQIWASMSMRAGPALTQSSKFELAATLEPLTRNRPAAIHPAAWDLALARTRAMLIAAVDDDANEPPPPPRQRHNLRDKISSKLLRTTNDTAAADLLSVWDTMAEADRVPEGFERPSVEPAGPEAGADGGG